jgi:two-component system cell cycle response regulator DivK
MKKQILVVDDDSKNTFALCAVLLSRGFNCIPAQSAQDGLTHLLENEEIGIVLMDMMMPDMDGYEAIAKIKAEETLNNIPIIAVTAQAMSGDKEKCLEAGASDYLPKPVDIDLLINKINHYLDNGITNS